MLDRVVSALRQHARANQLPHRLDEVVRVLCMLESLLGSSSHGRKALLRIGKVLFDESPKIIVPTCPDYAHTDGRYTFAGITGGVPLLAQRHIDFLDDVCRVLPNASITFVLADQEALDPVICTRLGVTQEEFLQKIDDSVCALHEVIRHRGWQSVHMTKRFPTLLDQEVLHVAEIRHSARYRVRIDAYTVARGDMYRKLGVYNTEAMRERTIRTAAQYTALAELSIQESFLICNHETVNLSWYHEKNAAVLHNPVCVY